MIDNTGNNLPLLTYFRRDRLPTMFCAGCGIGTVVTAFLQAVDELHLDPARIATVTGIGCTGRIGGYLSMDTLHGTHGRALAAATGAKAVRPDMELVVFLGDGDGISIGGNHLIHAANRGIDITAIMINNLVYGLTGGQASPTTPTGMRTTTTPAGKEGRVLDACKIVAAAGASFVARWTTLRPRELKTSIAKALTRPGFRFIEVISQCPPVLGRYNRLAEPEEMVEWIELRAASPSWELISSLEEKMNGSKWVLGEFVGGDQ